MLEHHRLLDRLDYNPATGVFRWRVSPSTKITAGAVAGCSRPSGWAIKLDGQVYRARRLVWLYVYGVWPEHEVRHADGDGDNCRLANIVASDFAQRIARHPNHVSNPCGVQGIYASATRYRVQLYRGGQSVHRSSHRTLEAAIAARQIALAAFDQPGGGSGL